jgi:hypothetical protein
MFESEIIQFCIRHRIKVEQYFFMWLLLRKDWNRPFTESLARQYLKIAKFTLEDISDLEERGFIINMNTPPNTLPEFYIVNDEIANEIFAGESAGEELWKAYPPQFPLSTGGYFVARAGLDKDEMINLYLKKINNSPSKHKFVLEQIQKYKVMVKEGKLLGKKLFDFISEETWDTIAEIERTTQKKQGFGRDI